MTRHRLSRGGMAIVEFAVASGILVTVFAGTFQFGYSLLQYNELQNAVSQAARYASMIPYDSRTTTPSIRFLESVRNMAVYGSPVTGARTVVAGLNEANVQLKVNFSQGVPSSMTVAIANFPIHALFGTITLSNKPQTTFPYVGIWTPY